MTREPDRSYDAGHDLWKRLQGQGTSNQIGILIAALRQAADEALERAAQAFANAAQCSGPAVASLLRYMKPAAAPAAEKATCVDCKGRGFRGDGHGGRTRCTECDGTGTVPRGPPTPPSDPIAPSLLPRVLAALEQEASAHDDFDSTYEHAAALALLALAAELRAYIAEREPAEKRIAELESALRWALGEEDHFPPRELEQGQYWWRTELRRRAKLAARAATTKGEGT